MFVIETLSFFNYLNSICCEREKTITRETFTTETFMVFDVNKENVENYPESVKLNALDGSPEASEVVFVPRVRWVSLSLRGLCSAKPDCWFCFLARRKSTWRSEEISYISNMLWERTGAKSCYKKEEIYTRTLFYSIVEEFNRRRIFLRVSTETFIYSRAICFEAFWVELMWILPD